MLFLLLQFYKIMFANINVRGKTKSRNMFYTYMLLITADSTQPLHTVNAEIAAESCFRALITETLTAIAPLFLTHQFCLKTLIVG